MIIESLDDLKVWLIKELEPICDADPAALAKYVIALAKKDKAENDLKALCEDQLDVFLGEETKPFVGNLFEVLKNKTYLPPPQALENSEKEVPVTDVDGKGIKRKSFEENLNKNEGEKLQKTENKVDVSKAKTDDKENIDSKVFETSVVKNDLNPKTENSLDVNGGVQNDESISRDIRMRSVSQDRSMKSMSPAIRSNRHSHAASSRRRSSRSPTARSSRHSRRQPSSRTSRKEKETHDSRTRDRRYKNSRRDKERCRDYEEKGYCMLGETCRFDHGRDPVEVDDRNLPQMLSLAASSFPATQANSHIPNPPIQVFPPGVMPARPLVAPIGAPQMPPTLNTGLASVRVQNTRPVPSPVELPPGQMPPPQVPIFRPRNPIAFMRNLTPGVPGSIRPSGMVPSVPRLPQTTQVSALGTTTGEPYNPEEPSIENDATAEKSQEGQKDEQTNQQNRKSTSENKTDSEENKTQDELVRIAMGNVPLTPILGTQQNSLFNVHGNPKELVRHQSIPIQAQQMMNFPDLLPQTYLPMAVNSQIVQHHQQMSAQNTVVEVPPNNKYQGGRGTVLEIRKIPKHLNNMVKLSEHFTKFGTITKLQTPFDQDAQGALIEFSTNREAYAAYSSPEAILGNRFIKMFWYKPPKEDGRDKKTSNNTTSEEQPAKKVANSNELKYRNPKSNPKLLQMEKKKELENLEKRKLELKKKKQESYQDLVKKQKDILLKLQEKRLSKEEKTKLLKTFKSCDAAVKKLEKELQEESKAKAQQSPTKPFHDTKKEILDKEIDIYHGNLEGDELLEAKRDLELLKQETTYGYNRGRGHRGRGRGNWHRGRGRGRGGFSTTSIDNRPKRILVADYDDTEKDAVVAHFAKFGQVSQIEEIDTTKMVLTFPTRRSAEVAAIQGTDFNGKQLTLSWFTGQTNKTSIPVSPQKIQRRVTRSLSQSLMDKELEDELLEDLDKEEEEMLLAGVEDEEEDEEEGSEHGVERSWKR